MDSMVTVRWSMSEGPDGTAMLWGLVGSRTGEWGYVLKLGMIQAFRVHLESRTVRLRISYIVRFVIFVIFVISVISVSPGPTHVKDQVQLQVDQVKDPTWKENGTGKREMENGKGTNSHRQFDRYASDGEARILEDGL